MSFFSWVLGKKNYEKLLEEQDKKIRQHQTQHLKYSLRTKSVPTLISRIYLGLWFLSCCLIYFTQAQPTSYFLIVACIVAFYLLNFITSKIIVYYYLRNSNAVEISIEQLIIDQRELLEEYKQEYNFYKAQEIVAKYERVLRYFEKKVLNFTEEMYRDDLMLPKEKKQFCEQETQTPEELLPKIKVYVPQKITHDNTEKSERERLLEETIQKLQHALQAKQLQNPKLLMLQQDALSPSKLYSQKEIDRHAYPPSSPKTPSKHRSSDSMDEMFDDRVVVDTPVKPKSGWFDKVLDKIIGQSPEHCIALICGKCFSHNGLQMLEDAHNGYNFKCWKCKKLNVKLSDSQRRALEEAVVEEPLESPKRKETAETQVQSDAIEEEEKQEEENSEAS